MNKPEPWNPTDATNAIRMIARHPAFSLAYKVHARDRRLERGLLNSDIIFLLQQGFVYDEANPAKSKGYFTYRVLGHTPNSDGRRLAAVTIPSIRSYKIKLVTVMWEDELETRSGSILRED